MHANDRLAFTNAGPWANTGVAAYSDWGDVTSLGSQQAAADHDFWR